MTEELAEALRIEAGRATALLVRLTGDFELAEDAVQDALVVATERWQGLERPDDPGAWLRVTARHKAIDRLRREKGRAEKEGHAMQLLLDEASEQAEPDDTLRLLFTCCHPALTAEARVALSLRTISGLSTREIARAFLVSETTISQRIHRAKKKIARAHIPYRVPSTRDLPDRLGAVLSVLYLVFTTGHNAEFGAVDSRTDLARDAIRLARDLIAQMPEEPEVVGLLALMLAAHARSAARTGSDREALTLAEQDRTRWDLAAIEEASRLVDHAFDLGPANAYTLEAAIACLHGRAPTYEATDWRQIVGLYRLLERARPTPVETLTCALRLAHSGTRRHRAAENSALTALCGPGERPRRHRNGSDKRALPRPGLSTFVCEIAGEGFELSKA